ncbi:hypothetical protein RD792_006952 [Penstemon davidsonii]|uniref:Fertilization-independent endosperm protein n=1 Tax=Penstemon davidsonii TaxID=160366 RepID=A0ABR0D6V1_9LAMI|nr:hypothetical protein RD792_006952 [Penstemon davidsonii]
MAKIPLGCEPVVGSPTPSRKREYRVTNRLQEGKRPIYSIVFNFMDSRYFNTFATAGGNRVTVYQCLEGGIIGVLQSYIDEDVRNSTFNFFNSYTVILMNSYSQIWCAVYRVDQKDESFYTVSWACNIDGTPFLVAGGLNGIIRVIDTGSEKIYKSFVGHGDSINEIKTQPLKPSLVLSASKDESVRLWNIHTGICILIFAGSGGHRNEVLSVDFHPSDIYRIASCGMDNTVKIWSMKEFWTYVEKSFTWTDLPSKFPTKYVQFPSVDSELVLWEPRMKEQSPGENDLILNCCAAYKPFNEFVQGTVDILQKYPVPECDIWFIKFSYDFHLKTVAIGNREGKIYVWEVQSNPPILVAKLTHAESKSTIRLTAMSYDGSTILSCCDDGTIWRWDVVASS